jgi:hypothetical protein
MKRIIYLLLALLGFSAASCEEHTEMPMYACPAPEYNPSDSDDCGEEHAEVKEENIA